MDSESAAETSTTVRRIMIIDQADDPDSKLEVSESVMVSTGTGKSGPGRPRSTAADPLPDRVSLY